MADPTAAAPFAGHHVAVLLGGLSSEREVSLVSGRGIGLAAVRQVVQKHGGTITVRSARDRGTAFRITVPKQAERVAEVSA